MSFDMQNDVTQDVININGSVPEDETQRQFYYMEKAAGYVAELAKRLGHKPTCCVTTFGCPMVIVTQKCGKPLFI